MSESKRKSRAGHRTSADPLYGDLSELLEKAEWQKVRFELKPKDRVVTIRMSDDLLIALKSAAERKGLNYQKYIRLLLEESLERSIG